MGSKKDKWTKWKIGASSAAAVFVLLSAMQQSEAYRNAVLDKEQAAAKDTYIADESQPNSDFVEQWSQSGSMHKRGYNWNQRNGSSNDESSGSSASGQSSGSITEQENSGGMQSRTGRS